jgi:hypothetical protein
VGTWSRVARDGGCIFCTIKCCKHGRKGQKPMQQDLSSIVSYETPNSTVS